MGAYGAPGALFGMGENSGKISAAVELLIQDNRACGALGRAITAALASLRVNLYRTYFFLRYR
jgi:hypothetical protein